MNLLLLHPNDKQQDNTYRVDGRRARHIRKYLKLTAGDTLRAGLLNGPIGTAALTQVEHTSALLTFEAEEEAPAASPIRVIIALPRPKVLGRLLADITAFGVKEIVLLNSQKVEKSYWDAGILQSDLWQDKLYQGLEQAKDTQLPRMQLEPHFNAFIRTRLPALLQNGAGLIAHPGPYPTFPSAISAPTTVAIGPEGGWTTAEKDAFLTSGFQCHQLGTRILRVETAVSAILGRLAI